MWMSPLTMLPVGENNRSTERMSGSELLRRLVHGLPITALGIRSSRTAEIARLAKASGHDAIWVDLEHSSMPVDVAAQICSCAFDLGLFPFVRIPEREYGIIGRLLDGGAVGVIAPRTETAAQAAEFVAACRFPPLGHRSTIALLPSVNYRRLPAAELNEIANSQTLVNVLVESAWGIENLAAMAAVPGVDLISIGTNDLCAELGVPGDFRHPKVRAAHDHALAVCRSGRKPLAIGGIGDLAYSAELVRLGAVPFLMTGIDTDMLLSAASERVRLALASI
jgi:4-hydroxy-2-oxoheptanedioate aldolase